VLRRALRLRYPACNGRAVDDRLPVLFDSNRRNIGSRRMEGEEIRIQSRQRTSKSPMSFPSRKRITKAL